MLEINKLEEVRGNNVIIYSIRTLLSKNTFPKFAIMSGHMGVGKSTVARLVAQELNQSEQQIKVFNFGMDVDMKEVEEVVFRMNPSQVKAFIFEEMQGLDKSQQTALLTMLDKQPSNVYIIATTTEIYRILKTIRSRATVWDFKLLGEKQLAQLLDDYLNLIGKTLNQTAKSTLLKSCWGVPRDLLKNVDLALSGDFNSQQLNELLGQMSEDLVYSLLCSLKSTSVDFVANMNALIDESSKDKLFQFRDFFTRFILERKGIDNCTLSKDKIETLNSIFNDMELYSIGKTLIRSTPDTFNLELAILNMKLTSTSNQNLVGQQIDRVAQNLNKSYAVSTETAVKDRRENAKITISSAEDLKFE